MQALGIILISIIAAVVYGIVHDQITSRICVEYFTIGHPPIFHTDDPTLLGLGWGIIATWWAGLMIGIPLAIACRAGSRPKRSPQSLVRPVVSLLMIMGISAVAAGMIGGTLAHFGVVTLTGQIANWIPDERHVPFLVAWWAHSASYLIGFAGGMVLSIIVWRSRGATAESLTESLSR